MTLETLISNFLSYPIGLAVNASSDKLKKIIDVVGIDSIEPLKGIFIKSFFKAIDEHATHYDEYAKNITSGLKDQIKKNPEKLFDIFTMHSCDRNLLYIMKDKEYREKVARDIVVTYIDEKETDTIRLDLIVLDCLSYYKNIFLKHMSEKEGIITILENSLELRNEVDRIIQLLTITQESHNFLERYDDYKKSVINNFSEINFFGLGLERYKKKKKRELSKIYVKPRFNEISNEYLENLSQQFASNTTSTSFGKIDFEESDFTFSQVLNSISENKNIVILGNPGAGKSILVKYIIYILLKGDKTEFINKSIYDYFPFRIELRKYIKEKRVSKCNIISYLKTILISEYGIDLSSINSLSEFFYTNNTLVFFDGLDEIFDINEKVEVRNDIINFTNHYTNSKAIVTSRIIGYDDARFNSSFTELRILNFNDNQIKQYINNWYCQDCEDIETCKNVCKDNIKDEINVIIKEISNLEDELKRNPLLLSLIIILYQNNGQLPNSKLELYKSCTKTLVDNWDKAKTDLDIKLDENLNKRKENIFSALALWQYIESSNKSKKIKINNKSVLKQVEKTINNLELTDDINEAERWANIFIEYAEKRSLYFENTFTHKTFWEYYAATRIFQEYYLNDEIKLYELIDEYIENSFWFDVIELLFNMIDEVQCDNKKIKKIIDTIISGRKGACLVLMKIIPSIVNVSNSTIKDVIKTSILTCIINLDNDNKNNENNILSYQIFEEIRRLNNRGMYCNEVIQSFDEIYCDMVDEKLLLKYYIFYYEFNTGNKNKGILKLSNREKLEELKNIYPRLYVEDLIELGNRSPEVLVKAILDFCSKFKDENINKDMPFLYSTHTFRTSLLDIYLNQQMYLNNLNSFIPNISFLISNGFGLKYIAERKPWHIRIDNNRYIEYLNVINNTENLDIILVLLNWYKDMINEIIMDKQCTLEEIASLYSKHRHKQKIFENIEGIFSSIRKVYIDEVAGTLNKDL